MADEPRRRRRRRRGGRGRPEGHPASGRQESPPRRAERSGPPIPVAPGSSVDSAVDSGWDEPTSLSDPSLAEPKWGDDKDAPVPEIRLASEGPTETEDQDGEVLADWEEHQTIGVVVQVVGIKFHSAGK